MKYKIKFVFVVLCILTVLLIAGCSQNNNVENSDSITSNSKTNQINVIKQVEDESNPDSKIPSVYQNTTIRQIVSDYKENEIKAEMIYNGKIMQIIGKISEIGTDKSNNPYLVLFGQSDWDNAKFIFADKNDLINVNKYDIINVQCKIYGDSLAHLFMGNCKLIEVVEKNQEIRTETKESNSILYAYDIIEDYYSNEFYADKKYKNKNIKIEGIIKVIKNNPKGEPIIVLKSGNYYWDGLNCYISEAKERILLFSTGDRILISGSIMGQSDNSIEIKNCIIDEEWSNKKNVREDSDNLIAEIELIGYLEEQATLPYKNEKDWDNYCEDWDLRDNCEAEYDWDKCNDLYNCNEIKITSKDFKDWHNVEVIINDNYLVAFDPYNRVAPKYKFQPNQAILEKGGTLKFGSKMITCLLADQDSKKDSCDSSKNKIVIQEDMVNYERYNEKLCNCESFSFAQTGEPIKSIRITANEGSYYKSFFETAP